MPTRLTDQRLAYVLLRWAVGVNMAIHGAVRLPKLGGFAAWMQGKFEASILPSAAVGAWAHTLPFVELTIGLCLILGLGLRPVITAALLVVTSLILGSGLIEDWSAIGMQMVYIIAFYILLVRRGDDAWGVDVMRAERQVLEARPESPTDAGPGVARRDSVR